MKITKLLATGLATVAAILLVGPGAIQAQDLSYAELAARLTALESQLQTQQTDFASYNTGGGPEQFGCKDCSKTVCNCGCPAWYAGYEITFLRPYISDANGFGPFGDDYGTGHRFVLGYDNGSGLGARVRYWTYNHNHPTAVGAPAVHIDMDVLDGEVTLQETMHNWNLLVAGGLRYARLAFDVGAGDVYFEGIGPTVALEATRNIGSRGVYLIGNFRASTLFGDIRSPGPGPFALGPSEDEITLVLENQLGVGWSREFGRGIMNIRGVWESQFWMNDTFADSFNGAGSNLGFSGPTASIEFRL
jgi:hypothetical protein